MHENEVDDRSQTVNDSVYRNTMSFDISRQFDPFDEQEIQIPRIRIKLRRFLRKT